MARKVTFTNEQWEYIMEKCGVTHEQMQKIDEVTVAGAASDGGSSGPYTVPFTGVKKNDPTMIHQKPGGVCCGHVGEDR